MQILHSVPQIFSRIQNYKMLRVTVRLHKKLLMWLWVGFVRLEVNIWLQADHMDQDPLQHVVDDFFFIFFLSVYNPDWRCRSSFISSLFTNYTYLVKCFWIKMLIFLNFFFCSFSFSKLLKYYRNLCDKNSLRQEKYKKKKKESEGSATFFSLQPSLCLTSF